MYSTGTGAGGAVTGSRTSCGGAAAGAPGTHGDHTQLVWSRTMDDTGATVQLVMSDPNGHGLQELTNPGEGVRDVQPKVSPNGRRVVFKRDYPDHVKILMVGTNGRGEREVPIECTDPCADPLEPAWTSDGQHIIFTLVVGPFDLVNEWARSRRAVDYGPRREGILHESFRSLESTASWRTTTQVSLLTAISSTPG